jgi:RimJ/RimL family protein N-acetyltransferase
MMSMSFRFNNNYVLENDFVILSPLQKQDFENLLPFALNESDLWKYSLISAGSEEKMKNYIEVALENKLLEKEYPFIVYDKKRNAYAGSTRFYDIQLDQKTLQLGYTWYGKEFQGTGLNKQCKFLLLKFAFDEMNFERVEFRADNNNAKSIAAMKSIGCKVEGVIRSHLIKEDGTRRDSIILSILRNEWNDSVKKNLINKISL